MFGNSNQKIKIEDEIRRLERRHAEIEAQLKAHSSPMRQNALQQRLTNLDRTLISLRQQQNRLQR